MALRITNDGNERDIEEIHRLLKAYNLRNWETSESVPLGIFYEDAAGKNRLA